MVSSHDYPHHLIYDSKFLSDRELVLNRDDYTCLDCGEKFLTRASRANGCVVVHHLDYTSNEQSNLVTLCASCHRKRHTPKGYNKKTQRGDPKMAKTIAVKDETHARMRELGRMDESFDALINRIIEGYIAFTQSE